MEDNPMKNLKTVAVSALTISGFFGGQVMAAEEKYPAYNFEPTVIFSNAELIEKTHSGLSAASSSQSIVAAAHETDPKYPAAYFNPTILYPAR